MLIWRDGGLSTLCNSCGFDYQRRVLKTFPGPGYARSEDGVVWLWHLLVNLYIWAHHFILLWLNPLDLRVDREWWWFEHSVSQLWVWLSAEGAENIFFFFSILYFTSIQISFIQILYKSPLRGWDIMTMAFTIKFVNIVHHFILLMAQFLWT